MEAGCLGQLPECFEPEPPFRPVGAPAQAWSVAEVLRVLVRIGEG
jgi:glycogen debranching enzyme